MKKTPGYTDEEREQYWVDIINNARRHPDGVSAYLLDKGINKNNYYQWFKRLRKSHPEWHDLASDSKHRAMKQRARNGAKLPKTEVSEKARRRRWSPQEKIRILDEFENAAKGKGAAVLRREGIYFSQIHQWRMEREEGGLEPKKRGPKANPAAEEIRKLKAQLAKSQKKLAQANAIIELQKKVAKILETSLELSDEDE